MENLPPEWIVQQSNDPFANAKITEYTAIRQVLSSHPFLYQGQYCKRLAVEVKQHVKSKKGTAGVFCLFAFGDAPEHAPDQEEPMPDFKMDVAVYNETDLQMIAEASLKSAQAQQLR